jgi:hypothetical protein
MRALKRSVILSVLVPPCLAIVCIAALLASPAVSFGQSTVHRLGVTLGGEAWMDGNPLRKNPVVNNPGFEAADYRGVVRCSAVTADGCRVADANTAGQNGFWNGAHYQVMSGGAAGATGTVDSYTSGGDGSVLALDKSLNLSAGDYLSVEVLRPERSVKGWSSSVGGGGSITPETEDLSSETSGKQALLLSAPGRSGSARLSQEIDAQPGQGNLQLNGAYELSFRARGVGGDNRLNVSVGRETTGNDPYLSRPVTLTDSWAQYTMNFSAAETGSQSSPLQLSFTVAGANVELDDVSLQQSNSDSANPTAFRDEVINGLKELHPGTIRMAPGSSDVLTQLVNPFARYTPDLSGAVTSTPRTAYGIQEFLELCATVGADPWITVAASTTPSEMKDLVLYLTGDGSDTWSALRIARGQAKPWTSVFGQIDIELENGTGIGGSASEPMASLAYASWSDAVFGAARRSPGYSASKLALIPIGSATVPPALPTLASNLAAETSTAQSAVTNAPIINCSSGFASSGACGTTLFNAWPPNQPFAIVGSPNGATPSFSGSAVDLIPVGATHNAVSLNYYTPVNVQAFSTTFTFIPNGWNIAFVLQNNTNTAAAPHGIEFSAGAGCEGGFYQVFDSNNTPPNNIFALELDQQSPLINTNGLYLPFTYSSVQIYQAGQSPCNPNDDAPDYYFTPKFSTSPVSLNSPFDSQGTTTGHTYSVTLNYNGSTLSMHMFDVTVGGSCPGASCFTQDWTVNIPALVGSNTAYLGFTGGTNAASSHPLYVSSLVYGVLSAASTPTFSPAAGTYTGSQSVTISDSTPGKTIYYTTDGTTPTSSSSVYSGPITVSSTQTLKALAAASGYFNSSVASATYTIKPASPPPMPTFSVAAGTYTSAQTVSISDAAAGANIYYTTNGTAPTTSSTRYSGAVTVSSTETLEAVAVVGDPTMSSVAKATYTIESPSLKYPSGGFKVSSFDLNGGAVITSGGLLQLTDGGSDEARSAWFASKLPVQSFTTDFTFQLSNPAGDGITFTIQNSGPTALGGYGAGLGFVTIQDSLAIKFDLANSEGEGPDATGLYTWGNLPTVPSINLTSSGINLHDGNPKNVHITYDGTTLSMTITDPLSLATFSRSWAINIPATVFGNTAWVGFTGSTGANTASQKVTSWTYVPGPPAVPNYAAGIDSADLILNGATIAGSGLQLTTAGATNHASTAYYALPVDVEAFTSTFDFKIQPPAGGAAADGMTFVIQNAGPKAIGGYAAGLGYVNIPNSVAIKFDTYNNAGEGNDSTGVFTYGNLPTVPAIDLTSSGLQLGNGHTIQAVVSYDGTTLTWGLTDLSDPIAGLRATETKVIDIPHYVGGNVAYIGFTGATGLGTSTQTILNWTFANP